jgi:hypothetical protein
MSETYNPTWWERGTMPDLITRGLNVGSGAPTTAPDYNAGDQAYTAAPVTPWLTQPAQRPSVTQRMLNFNVVANTPAVPLASGRVEVVGIIFDVYSTAAASVFWGPSGVTVTTGIEVRPGVPGTLALDQVREQWELQRSLEYIAALVANATSSQIQGPYKAPRVILDLSQIYVASVAAQAVTIVAFLPPELQ